MADSELKCLLCKENIIGVSVEGERFWVLCVANDGCVEKEDQNLEEKFIGIFSKKQLEFTAKLIGIKFRVTINEL